MQAHERTRTRLDPELRRSQIVEAAVRVFSETDPVEVTFEEIAEAAGVSRALVYNYFGDRGGLVAAVYLHTFDELNDQLNATIDPTRRRRTGCAPIVHRLPAVRRRARRRRGACCR